MNTDSEFYFWIFIAVVGVVFLCIETIHNWYELKPKNTANKEKLYKELTELVRVAKKIKKENPEIWEKAEKELQLNEEEKVFSP